MSLLSYLNPLSANLTKWSNTLKQFVGKLPANCLSVFDHFVGLALKGLIYQKCFLHLPPQFQHKFVKAVADSEEKVIFNFVR